MKIAALRERIHAADLDSEFAIRAVPQPTLIPDVAVVLEPASDGSSAWVVFGTDRGRVYDLRTFESEDRACDFVDSLVLRDERQRQNVHTLTSGELERGLAMARRREIARRSRLRESGTDPETGHQVHDS